MIRWKRLERLAAIAVVFVAPVPVRAQPSLEYSVKAALLLNFPRFIEWPESAFSSAQSPIEVCIVAASPFGDALARALEGETVGARTLITREVRTPSESSGCHLLFVPAGTESHAAALLKENLPHTVTVGESDQFEQMGGAVRFVLDGGRVRFNVNLRPVEQRGVRISARMLKLANRVDRATPEK